MWEGERGSEKKKTSDRGSYRYKNRGTPNGSHSKGCSITRLNIASAADSASMADVTGMDTIDIPKLGALYSGDEELQTCLAH